MQNTLQFHTDKNCHSETTGCQCHRDLSPANRLVWSLSLDMTCELVGDLQAENSVGQVIFIRKNQGVDFAVRYQALLCVMGKI